MLASSLVTASPALTRKHLQPLLSSWDKEDLENLFENEDKPPAANHQDTCRYPVPGFPPPTHTELTRTSSCTEGDNETDYWDIRLSYYTDLYSSSVLGLASFSVCHQIRDPLITKVTNLQINKSWSLWLCLTLFASASLHLTQFDSFWLGGT